MNPSRLTRRLLVGAAGLALGVAGTLALASPASAHHPEIAGQGVCDTATGEFVITWTVTSSGFAGAVTAVEANPDTAVSGIEPGAALPENGAGELTGEQRVPGTTTYASLKVTVEFPDGTEARDGMVELAGDCKGDGGGGGEEPPVDEELGEFTFDCETLTITFTNPTEEELTVTFVPSTGDAMELTVAAGETGEAEFPAAEGLSIEVQVNGETVPLTEPIEITSEEWAELNCDEDGGGEGGGDDDSGLPVTGSSTGLIAGGALALLALGGGMYLVARRRRVTFTT